MRECFVSTIDIRGQGRYKLEDPHEAGMAILGKLLGPFIDMALKLGEDIK